MTVQVRVNFVVLHMLTVTLSFNLLSLPFIKMIYMNAMINIDLYIIQLLNKLTLRASLEIGSIALL